MIGLRPTTCVKLALLAISIILMAAAVFIGTGIIVAPLDPGQSVLYNLHPDFSKDEKKKGVGKC